jgi:hypothetical protein
MFLKENSMQDILNQTTDTEAAHILLALLNGLLPKKARANQETIRINTWDKVARERFELSSMAPKATMLGHYTTGL